MARQRCQQRADAQRPALCGGIWHPAQVSQLLQAATTSDRDATLRRAVEFRAQGIQLCEIGIRLATERFRPPAGGLWHPSQVHALLAQSASEQSTE